MPRIKTNTHGVVVDNTGLDPIQGYDAQIWVLTDTGKYNLVGSFTSMQVVIANVVEDYLEFNQSIARIIEGEKKISWVMERGQLDGRVIEQTFGTHIFSRDVRLNRLPRMNITFAIRSSDLDASPFMYIGGKKLENPFSVTGSSKINPQVQDVKKRVGSPWSFGDRLASMELVLESCVVESFMMGSSAGKSIIANRWQGRAEKLELVNRNLIGWKFYEGTTFRNTKSYADTDVLKRNSTFGDLEFAGSSVVHNLPSPYPWDRSGITQIDPNEMYGPPAPPKSVDKNGESLPSAEELLERTKLIIEDLGGDIF